MDRMDNLVVVMEEKKFELKSASACLQNIGMRAQIVSFLMSENVEKGNAINHPSDEHIVIVAIRLDSEEKIENIKNELVKHLNKLNASNKMCFPKFPSDIVAGELKNLDNPSPIVVMDFTFYAHSLMLGQTSKGAGAMLTLAGEMGKMAVAMNNLPNRLADILNKKK